MSRYDLTTRVIAGAWLAGCAALAVFAIAVTPPKASEPVCHARMYLDGTVVYTTEGCLRIPAKRWERVRLNHSPLTSEQRLAYEVAP